MKIAVEENLVAMQFFFYIVGEAANKTKAGFFEQKQAVFVCNTMAVFYFISNGPRSCEIAAEVIIVFFNYPQQRYSPSFYRAKNPYLPLSLSVRNQNFFWMNLKLRLTV